MSGKGSTRRPQNVSNTHIQSEWDRLFNKKEERDMNYAPLYEKLPKIDPEKIDTMACEMKTNQFKSFKWLAEKYSVSSGVFTVMADFLRRHGVPIKHVKPHRQNYTVVPSNGELYSERVDEKKPSETMATLETRRQALKALRHKQEDADDLKEVWE